MDRALRQDWAAVLYDLSRRQERLEQLKASNSTAATEGEALSESFTLVLEAAVRSGAWHVVSRLIRSWGHEGREEQRDLLMRRMMASKQWGVYRTLLERGVSMNVCQEAIPLLLERNQWLLLARVMERDDVTDDCRRRVVFHAVRRGEGSLVWHGLQMLTTPLTEAERQEMFRLALQHDAWQAVRPLVEQMDELGVQQRDEALRLAVDNHQWSVVDHCMKHRADLNKHVNLARKAEAKDWEAVEELAKREADVFAETSTMFGDATVLHIAVREKHWKVAKLLIQYHSKLLKKCRFNNAAPVRGIIDNQQARLIECALFWSPNVQDGRGKDMDTPLHAACKAGWPHTMYYLLARGCDPLAVNKHGNTVLASAVQLATGEKEQNLGEALRAMRRSRFRRRTKPATPDKTQEADMMARARRMLAQCIRLGFSTHQPAITRRVQTGNDYFPPGTSPMLYAIQQNSTVLMKMLYDSGACSNREITQLWAGGVASSSATSVEVKELLEEMVDVPRSLQSACRLAVSHCFNVRGKRHKEVEALSRDLLNTLLDDRVNNGKVSLRDYILFTDITDPYLNTKNA
jgi:hypothetical protein